MHIIESFFIHALSQIHILSIVFVTYIQECCIHIFFIEFCSKHVRVTMNPNITPSFSENSISSCYGMSNIVIVVLIRSVPRCCSDSTPYSIMSCFLQNNYLQYQCVSGQFFFTHCRWFTQILWYFKMYVIHMISVIASSFCISFQLGWLTSVSICLSSIPQMKFWSEYSFLLIPFLQQLLIVRTFVSASSFSVIVAMHSFIILESKCTTL